MKNSTFAQKSLAYSVFLLSLVGMVVIHKTTSQPVLSFAQGKATSPIATDPPRIRIESQPDSPIIISMSKTRSIDPYAPEFGFKVVNRSTRDINAYAVRYETLSETSKSGGMNLNNLSLTNQRLHPNSSRSETIEGISFSAPIKKIILSVDFVEFDDGSTWGIDVFRSAERLAGQRAGLRTVADLLLKKLKEGGPPAVSSVNESSDADVSPPPGQTSAWLDGFRSGKSIMRDRVRQASRQGDIRVIEAELLYASGKHERK